MSQQIRQGDVQIDSVDQIPQSAKCQKRQKVVVLALGETTGHAHVLIGETELYLDPDGEMFFEAINRVDFAHVSNVDTLAPSGDHAWHNVEPGIYRVTRQMQYAPAEIRRVAD